MSFALPLEISLGPSRLLSGLLAAGHAMVMGGVLLARPDPLGALIIPIALAGLLASLGQHGLRLFAGAATAMRVEADGRVTVILRDGRRHPAELLPSTFVHPVFTVVNLRLEGRRLSYHVILVGDAVDPAAFRRLRVWLRWGPRPGAMN